MNIDPISIMRMNPGSVTSLNQESKGGKEFQVVLFEMILKELNILKGLLPENSPDTAVAEMTFIHQLSEDLVNRYGINIAQDLN